MVGLKTYIFEHPTESRITSITRRSYVYAALFGAFYVLFSGFVGRFFLALLVDLLFVAAGLVVAAAVAAQMSTLETSVVLVFLVLAVMAARARPMISIVRTGYQKRGWFVTPI